MRRMFQALTVSLAFAAAPLAAGAADMTVELNRLEQGDNNCRALLVLRNGSEIHFTTYKLDLVFFNKEGIVLDRFTFAAAPIRARKPKVITVPSDGFACANVSEVLLNDVAECADASGPIDGCIDRVETEAKGGLVFN